MSLEEGPRQVHQRSGAKIRSVCRDQPYSSSNATPRKRPRSQCRHISRS